MNPKRQKAKDRRRARVLAEQAWEAANRGNLDLAEKIIRRAVSTQEDNPVLWNDQGVILGLRQKDSEAAKSFAAALSLAPTFADPYAHLAALRLRQGRVDGGAGPADPSRQVRSAEHIVRGATSDRIRLSQASCRRHADSTAAAAVGPTEVSSADPGRRLAATVGCTRLARPG